MPAGVNRTTACVTCIINTGMHAGQAIASKYSNRAVSCRLNYTLITLNLETTFGSTPAAMPVLLSMREDTL